MRRALSVPALVVAALVVMLAGSFAGAGDAGAAPGAPARVAAAPPGVDPRVFVIGDSVILGAHDALVGRLAGWQVTFIAKVSFFTWQAPAAIAAYRPAVGDISVVALGNNDGADPGLFAREIDQVMAAFGPVRKVLWVNLRQFRPWVPAANAQLVAATARYPNLEVVDWDTRATPDPSLVYTDGLHLTGAGQAAMASLVGERVDAAAAQLAAPPTTAPPPTVAAASAPATTAPPPAGRPRAQRTLRALLDPLGMPVAPAAAVDSPVLAPPRPATAGPTDPPSNGLVAVGAAAVIVGAGAWWVRRWRRPAIARGR